MKICYNKLQKLMIDNQMKRQDFGQKCNLSDTKVSLFTNT